MTFTAFNEQGSRRGWFLRKALLWSPPCLLPLAPAVYAVLNHQYGLVVLVIALFLGSTPFLKRALPYFEDAYSAPRRAQGEVDRRLTAEDFGIFRRHLISLNYDPAADIQQAAVAASVGRLPEMVAVQAGRTVNIVTIGGASSNPSARDIAFRTGTSSYQVSKREYDALDEGDHVRLVYYPNTRLVTRIERRNPRIDRFEELRLSSDYVM